MLFRSARRVELGSLAQALGDAERSTPIVTLCACPADAGAVEAARELAAAGFTAVRVLRGGLSAWQRAQAAVPPSAVSARARPRLMAPAA